MLDGKTYGSSTMLSSTAQRVSPERLMQFTFGFAPPLIIETAFRHGIFDSLDKGTKSLDDLCIETGATPISVLDLGAGSGVWSVQG